MDAMSDAIEGADVMLYGVSLRYKESANVSQTAVCMPCAWLRTESECWSTERVADLLHVCCCRGSVEWCALKELRVGRAQLPNCPT